MEFCKDRVFTSVNADELKAGDKVIVADCIADLKNFINDKGNVVELEGVRGENCDERFRVDYTNYSLAYLVERKENCTNCKEGRWDAEHKKILCDPVNCGNGNVIFRNHEIEVCEYYKPITKQKVDMPELASLGNGQYVEQKAEEKNCYNCRFTYTRDGVMRCMMNDHRCNNPEVACNHYESTTFEKHYRPFKDVDELCEAMVRKHTAEGADIPTNLDMPLIWVRRKEANTKGQLITEFGDGWGVGVGRGEAYNMTDLWMYFTFLDGSPCGVEE